MESNKEHLLKVIEVGQTYAAYVDTDPNKRLQLFNIIGIYWDSVKIRWQPPENSEKSFINVNADHVFECDSLKYINDKYFILHKVIHCVLITSDQDKLALRIKLS